MNISKFFCLAIAIITLFVIAPAAWALTPPTYDIKASVDTQNKTITAEETVSWTNDSSREISEIVFHIYPNRHYSKKEEDFMWQFAGYFKVNPFPDGFNTGSMKIHSIKGKGQNLPYEIQGNDQTILKINLPAPIAPGASVTLTINFTAEIPHSMIGRFGYHEDVFRFSRWYPILSVYEEGSGWNKNPFYPFHRPFYSEAAFYKVLLTIPDDQIIAHSGNFAGQWLHEESKTSEYYLESLDPIRDFSFAMSNKYRLLTEEFNGTRLLSYYLPGDEKSGQAALQSIKDLMAFYTKKFGPYPYAEFAVAPVDLGYGGEQMSNLIFIDRRAYRMPKIMNRYFDFLIAHEAGHQWFFNLIGVNEYEEMWLEEGFNSYFIEQYLIDKYGESGTVIDFPVWAKAVKKFLPDMTFKNTRDTRYRAIARVGMDHAIVSKLSSFSEPSAIFSVTYGKGARVLGMLRHYIGDETFEKIFHRIFSEYKFRNLGVYDFIRITEEESGLDLQSFYDQWLFGDKQLNYSVTRAGRHSVSLQNRGGISVPAEVVVRYKDGSDETFIWKGAPAEETIALNHSSAVKSVAIDPESHLLDIDRVNNHWPRRWHIKGVPLYTALQEISTMLPDDGYSLIAGPELANNGLGLKFSIQKPYDQIFYAASDYEFAEQLHHSRAGYQLRNLFNKQSSFGFEISNITDYDDGDDDLVSGKVYVRRELWPMQYNLADINDHVSLYLVRNQSANHGVDLLQREGIRNTNYRRHDEAIVGVALHLSHSGPAPDPRQGYQIDLFAENAGHFLEATQTFSRGALDVSTYVPLTTKSKAAFRVKYGGGYPHDKELFYAGGIDGLRGYERKSLRGSNMVLGSMEYRFPIIDGLKISMFDHVLGLESVSGVFFGDVGQAWFSSIGSSSLRKDAGFGLRFTVNIGSLFEKILVRADVAQAINDDREDNPRFWLGINHAF